MFARTLVILVYFGCKVTKHVGSSNLLRHDHYKRVGIMLFAKTLVILVYFGC